MKNELKALYLKDKALALKAAKVLGYRITAKSFTNIIKDMPYEELSPEIQTDLKKIGWKPNSIKTISFYDEGDGQGVVAVFLKKKDFMLSKMHMFKLSKNPVFISLFNTKESGPVLKFKQEKKE